MIKKAASVLAGATLTLSLLVVSPAQAREQQTGTVTMSAENPRVDYGDMVSLAGAVDPAAAQEVVSITDDGGNLLTQVTTDEAGTFSAALFPEHNTTVRAEWRDAVSDPVPLFVTPAIKARLDRVRLFADARVSGTVEPLLSGGDVIVKVFRSGRFLWKRRVPVTKGGFSTSFYVGKPGRYRAVAVTAHQDYEPARDETRSVSTRSPYLTTGSRGPYVKALEDRLRKLGYHLAGINREFDFRTADAVRAFNKVQGRPRSGSVDRSTWHALARPKIPRPRAAKPAFHIEVDQTKQVLYTVRRGRVHRILHVSTGAGNATRDGVFRVYRKLAGYSPNRLYYPSYFDGLRAIHGWPDVPTTNASHGCVRVPMWAAQWIYGLVDIGTEIRIYH